MENTDTTSALNHTNSNKKGCINSLDGIHVYPLESLDGDEVVQKQPPISLETAGVAEVEGAQLVWVYVYQNYAPSTFHALSQKATLSTAATIVAAVAKPPIAKVSDVIGRASTYCFTISCYLLSYILCAASPNFATYAVGIIFYSIGQTGTNILNDIIISDISTARWRTFAISISFLPFLIMPWVSALIVDSVVNGIGWRWGIGMLAFIMPVCASFVIATLFVYQRRAKRLGLVQTKKPGFYEFFALIDGGGLVLLCAGFAMFFLPISLASTTPSKWSTSWIIALIVLGAASLIGLVPYEKYVASHPILPSRYFRNATIVLAISIAFLDNLCFAATHTYLYSWVVVAHNYSAEKATFFIYLNGVVQALVGIIVGLVVYKLRRYKWVLFTATIVRKIGYGIMIRLRGANNSDAELFLVQAIQGLGSGAVQMICLTSAQIVVPHAELAQISALVLLSAFLGSGVGSSVAGGIYTNYFLGALRRHMAVSTSETTIRAIYNSIVSSLLPAWGSTQRIAANAAYSDVMR
ncbi:hypothetical protein MBLNU459_g4219t2 [Dothideomycetes sp. NU459]